MRCQAPGYTADLVIFASLKLPDILVISLKMLYLSIDLYN